MKRHLYLIGLILAGGFPLQMSATPRSLQEASSLATSFLAEKLHRPTSEIKITQLKDDALRKNISRGKTEANTPSYYIFNNNDEPGGYVIISGSDHLRPVLGYSLNNTFSDKNLPDNLQSWLTYLSEATEYVEKHPEAAISEAETATLSKAPVSQLLKNIAWGQTAPYNLLTPNNYPTGCMATAMAQVLYYYRYPEHGIGSNSYSWNGQTLSVDFAESTYNYDLMFDKSSSSVTAAQKTQVSKLSYDCGVSLFMNYGPNASGSISPYYPHALIQNFGYNNLTSIQGRDYYSFNEWNDMLYNELTCARPVIFTGSSSSGGHAFILDGYNQDGYYHVNWGWDGYYDGYYDVCVLNPTGTGTGASASSDGFSTNQWAVVQLTPTQNTGRQMCSIFGEALYASSLNAAPLGTRISFGVQYCYNFTSDRVAGRFGALITKDGVVVSKTPISTLFIDGSNGYIYGNSPSGYFTIPTTLSDGEYRLYAYYQPTGSDSCAIIRCRAVAPSYFNLTVDNGRATLSYTSYEPQLTVSDWSTADPANTYRTASPSTITAKVTNNHQNETFAGKFYLTLTSPAGWGSTVMSNEVLTIAPGETKQVSFTYTFTTPGQWKSKMSYSLQNISTDQFEISGTNQTFFVEADASALASFTLEKAPWIEDGSCELDTDITFGLELNNEGGDYAGAFRIQFFKTRTSTTPLLTIDNDATFAGESSGIAYVTGKIENLTPQTVYYASAYYYKGGAFVKLPTVLGVTNRVQVNVKRPTAIDAIYDDATKADGEVDIYNVLGTRIARVQRQNDITGYDLPAGVYIIDKKRIIIH